MLGVNFHRFLTRLQPYMNGSHMLKKISLFLISPDLSFRREIFLILPGILLLSLMTTCQEPGPAPDPFRNTTLALEIPDASCTEAWLRVSLTGDDTVSTALPVVVKRDAATVMELLLSPPKYDTLVVDDGLEPSQPYSYKAYRRNLAGTALVDSSDSATVTTMDTTSHDFSFETFTFGGEPGTGSSAFYDVAIIDENNIWAVGEIKTDEYDSTSGTSYTDYNAAHWDGERWELVKILSGHTANTGIMYFNENDIWVTSGLPIHWDGESWTLFHLWNMGVLGPDDGGVTRVWGSSPENIYFVGNVGTIVHYDGSGFTRLESGTDLPLHDIFGALNPVSREWEVISVGSNFRSDQPFQRVILKIENRTVRELSSRPMGYTLHSVWFSPETTYLVAGSGIWHKASLHAFDWQLVSLQGYYIFKIRGTVMNDIIAVGGYFEILHFNGLNWQGLEPGIPRTGNFKSVSMIGDLVVAVGFDGRRGIILKGQKL